MVISTKELNKRIAKREKQDLVKYDRQADGSYKCRKCGSVIMSTTIAHPIWDGPFAMSGSGQVFNEEVGYCPKCEKEPSFHGSPVAPPGTYHNP